MDLKQIQELIKMVSKSNISEITIESQEFKVKIKTGNANPVYIETSHAIHQHQAPLITQNQPQTQLNEVISKTEEPQVKKELPKEESSKYITIKSPIVGTFYRSSGPDKDVFVKVGDKISEGTVLCIIEAMKLFNEIESEHAGTIVKILVDDATPVEYDQPLFLIDPK